MLPRRRAREFVGDVERGSRARVVLLYKVDRDVAVHHERRGIVRRREAAGVSHGVANGPDDVRLRHRENPFDGGVRPGLIFVDDRAVVGCALTREASDCHRRGERGHGWPSAHARTVA